MNTHVDKMQENKSQSVANGISQMQSGGESTFQFVDNRPKVVAQRKLQEMANNSPQMASQEMLKNSPQAKQAAQLQAMAENYSAQQQKPIQKKENKMGLTNNLKADGIVVQRMDEGIGDRVGRRGRIKKMTSRQKKLFGGVDGDLAHARRRNDAFERQKAARERLRERVSRGLWNGSSRPSFTDETWDTMLSFVHSKKRADSVTVYQCENGEFYPLKRDRVGKEPFVTLDHHINWKQYILDNAEPEDDGEITKESAKVAYNDVNNLVVMSSSANSSKSGPKGRFD